MYDVVGKFRSFCQSIGGYVSELNFNGMTVVSCELYQSKRIGVTNFSGLVRIYSEDDKVTVEFEVREGFKVSANRPNHAVFEKAIEGCGITIYTIGDFYKIELTHKAGDEVWISLY